MTIRFRGAAQRDFRSSPHVEAAPDPARDGAHRDHVERLRQRGYEPRFLADGTPCAVVEQGACAHRVFVASIPKAGTYQVAAVLSALGIRDTMLHVDEGLASDFRQDRPGLNMWQYQFEMGTDDALRLVLPGQFAVGHLPPDAWRASLARFRVVFAYRELRHVLASWGRFFFAQDMVPEVAAAAARLPDGPDRVHWALQHEWSEWMLPNLRRMAQWRADAAAYAVRFEALAGYEGADAQLAVVLGLASHLGLALDARTAQEVASTSVGRATWTYTGSHSDLSRYWDERLEAWFRDAGGPELNRMLGYDRD
jgi:hypothetical protein